MNPQTIKNNRLISLMAHCAKFMKKEKKKQNKSGTGRINHDKWKSET